VTPILFVLAAGFGAIGRHFVGQMICSWQALLIVNTAASGLLGVIIGADLSIDTATILGIGFCGALSTYSSFALETQKLGWLWGSGYAALTIGCACAAASIGMDIV
jgi:CrcB protein